MQSFDWIRLKFVLLIKGTGTLLSCDQLPAAGTITVDNLLKSAISLYDISSYRRSTVIAVLSLILLLLSTVSPLLCIWYSRTCVAMVTTIEDNLKLFNAKVKVRRYDR